MSASGSITLVWAGNEHTFRLGIKQLRELQETVNRSRGDKPIGPMSLWKLIMAGDAWPDDLREVIRLGLIGGGTKLELVPGLVQRYVDERPLIESLPVAQAILGSALMGVPDDPVGKKTEAPHATTAATTELNSANSTDQGPPSGSHPDKSMNAHFGNSPHASKATTAPTVPTIIPARQ